MLDARDAASPMRSSPTTRAASPASPSSESSCSSSSDNEDPGDAEELVVLHSSTYVKKRVGPVGPLL